MLIVAKGAGQGGHFEGESCRHTGKGVPGELVKGAERGSRRINIVAQWNVLEDIGTDYS